MNISLDGEHLSIALTAGQFNVGACFTFSEILAYIKGTNNLFIWSTGIEKRARFGAKFSVPHMNLGNIFKPSTKTNSISTL